MPFNSTIRQKTCKVKGCTKYPILGGAGMCYLHVSVENKVKTYNSWMATRRKMTEKAIGRLRGQDFSKVVAKAGETKKKAKIALKEGKSELMELADKVFSQFIRNRAVEPDGKVTCFSCGNRWALTDKNENGDVIINCMHFVVRTVYSLRYNPDAAAAGCCWCNSNQNRWPDGVVYEIFRDMLVNKFGETVVAGWELEKRKINKLTVSILKEIILKYQVT